MTAATPPADAAQSPRAFRHRAYALYWTARVLATFAVQVVSVAVGWKIYDLTRDPLALGVAGLVQFLPSLLLVLVTGTAADRHSRRGIMALCFTVEALSIAALAAFSAAGLTSVLPIYGLLALLGVSRAFLGPAMQALVPNLVPPVALADAVGWNASSWQLATILGPVAGGLLYGVSEYAAYAVAFAMVAAATLIVVSIPRQPRSQRRDEPAWTTLSAGFRYVFTHRMVLGAVSLDLFAVLLGGAVALMPVYARDILSVGPWGLGLMRAAPGVGAIAMAGLLALRPIRSQAGLFLFAGVLGFGLATIAFGLSATPWISIVMLAAMGATDMVSVYVRETLIQLATPDDVRGRVNAVNMVFVGASNELGEFRAGVMASAIGAVPAVVVGGVGTVLVAAVWSMAFPELRRAERLDGR